MKLLIRVLLCSLPWTVHAKDSPFTCEFMLQSAWERRAAREVLDERLRALANVGPISTEDGRAPTALAFEALGLFSGESHYRLSIVHSSDQPLLYWIHIEGSYGEKRSFPLREKVIAVWKPADGDAEEVLFDDELLEEQPEHLAFGNILKNSEDEIRTFVAVEEIENLLRVSVGVDVPCNYLDKFSFHLQPQFVFLENTGQLCRVPVLTASFEKP